MPTRPDIYRIIRLTRLMTMIEVRTVPHDRHTAQFGPAFWIDFLRS